MFPDWGMKSTMAKGCRTGPSRYPMNLATGRLYLKRELTLNLEVYDLLLKFIRFVSVRFETVTFVSIEAQKHRVG